MRRSTRLLAAAAAALLTTSVLAACGDDGDDEVGTGDEPATTTTAAPQDGTGGADPADPVVPEDAYEPTQDEIDLAQSVVDRDPPQVEGVDDDVAPDALEISTVIEGEGREAATGDIVLAHYAGVLADGTPFDDSWSGGTPFDVQLGAGMVISGWDEGLVGAQAGERRRLVIGYDNAYGAEGRPPTIPEEATLVFEIDIVAVVPAD